jgi:acyl transferase domain-containing protein
VDVACVNSPVSTTISGDRHAIEALKKIFDHSSVFARLLKVDTAYHSYHMKIVAPRYLEAIGKCKEGLIFNLCRKRLIVMQ